MTPSLITPQQMLGGRKLIQWSRERLAAHSETTAAFIMAYELMAVVRQIFGREKSFNGLAAIRTALEAAGVEFTNGDEPGVKLRRK